MRSRKAHRRLIVKNNIVKNKIVKRKMVCPYYRNRIDAASQLLSATLRKLRAGRSLPEGN